MRKTIKYLAYTVIASVLALIFVISYAAGARQRQTKECSGLKVEIKDRHGNRFVSEDDITGFIEKEYGSLKGVRLNGIDCRRIESIIDKRSAVRKSQAYATGGDSLLHIEITQRVPVIRFQKAEGGFYADENGILFPLQSNFTSHVQVVDGDIPLHAGVAAGKETLDAAGKDWLDRMLGLVRYMDSHKPWDDDIVQITVRKGGDLVLVPKEGKEVFIFGTPDRFEEKFSLMEQYYKSIVPAKGTGHYGSVDVRFSGQIVCK